MPALATRSKAPSTAAQPCRLVTFSVSTYGTKSHTLLEMLSLYLAACRCFVAPMDPSGSERDLALQVPGLQETRPECDANTEQRW